MNDEFELKNSGRRDWLKQLGAAGVASVAPMAAVTALAAEGEHKHAVAGTTQREAFETLTAMQADTLEAVVERLIPSDEHGPGARQARAAHYIDRALAGPLARLKPRYVSGLGALNTHAESAKGALFAKLSPADQDEILTEMEKGKLGGFTPNAAAFFNMVYQHTLEGMFSDPYYGGNANYAGWDLIGYPGVRMAVTPEDQRMSVAPAAVRRSAYDDAMFGKTGGVHDHNS
jgi:gluconate 2-dehydrogenase gamma chain